MQIMILSMSSAVPAIAQKPLLSLVPDPVSYQPAVPQKLLHVRQTLLLSTWPSGHQGTGRWLTDLQVLFLVQAIAQTPFWLPVTSWWQQRRRVDHSTQLSLKLEQAVAPADHETPA